MATGILCDHMFDLRSVISVTSKRLTAESVSLDDVQSWGENICLPSPTSPGCPVVIQCASAPPPPSPAAAVSSPAAPAPSQPAASLAEASQPAAPLAEASVPSAAVAQASEPAAARPAAAEPAASRRALLVAEDADGHRLADLHQEPPHRRRLHAASCDRHHRRHLCAAVHGIQVRTALLDRT